MELTLKSDTGDLKLSNLPLELSVSELKRKIQQNFGVLETNQSIVLNNNELEKNVILDLEIISELNLNQRLLSEDENYLLKIVEEKSGKFLFSSDRDSTWGSIIEKAKLKSSFEIKTMTFISRSKEQCKDIGWFAMMEKVKEPIRYILSEEDAAINDRIRLN